MRYPRWNKAIALAGIFASLACYLPPHAAVAEEACYHDKMCVINHDAIWKRPDIHGDLGLDLQTVPLIGADHRQLTVKVNDADIPLAVMKILAVNPTGPLHLFGIRAGQVVLTIGGMHVSTAEDAVRLIKVTGPGEEITIQYADIAEIRSNPNDNGRDGLYVEGEKSINVLIGDGSAYDTIGQAYVKENKNGAKLPNGDSIATATILVGGEAPMRKGDTIFSIDGKHFSSVAEMHRYLETRKINPFAGPYITVGYFSGQNAGQPRIAGFGTPPAPETPKDKFLRRGFEALAFLIVAGAIEQATEGLAPTATEAAAAEILPVPTNIPTGYPYGIPGYRYGVPYLGITP